MPGEAIAVEQAAIALPIENNVSHPALAVVIVVFDGDSVDSISLASNDAVPAALGFSHRREGDSDCAGTRGRRRAHDVVPGRHDIVRDRVVVLIDHNLVVLSTSVLKRHFVTS
jgi:hypothetical protein